MLRYLIEHHNAPVTLAGMMHNHWTTPLMQAARDGRVDMVRLLLQLGAEVDVGSSLSPMIGQFRSPLGEAVRENHQDHARILVGLSPPIVCTRELSRSIHQMNFAMAEMLLHHGTHPEFRQEGVPEPQAFLDGSQWLQPLLLAVINRDLNTVKLLLNKGANPNVWCSYQPEDSFVVFYKHVLFWAVEYGHVNWRGFPTPDDAEYLAMVRLLLEGGANPNKFDTFGQTPLTYAIEAGHEAVVKCLLDHGANPYWAVNKSGQKLRSVPQTKESIRAMFEEAEVKQ